MFNNIIGNEANKEILKNIVENNNLEEAIQALKVLGYTRQEIEGILAKIDINT